MNNHSKLFGSKWAIKLSNDTVICSNALRVLTSRGVNLLFQLIMPLFIVNSINRGD